jgi:hypothetical protein
LPSDVLRQLKDLGYDVVELETPSQEYGLEVDRAGPKKAQGPIKTAQIVVIAREPDPGLAQKNAEAAKALAEKFAKPKQKLRGTLDQKIPANDIKNLRDKFSEKDQSLLARMGKFTGKQQDKVKESPDGPGGWISDMSFSGDSARCTIHYRNETEKSALETRARAEMNSILNDKSYVRKEANREAYPALAPTMERDGFARGIGR